MYTQFIVKVHTKPVLRTTLQYNLHIYNFKIVSLYLLKSLQFRSNLQILFLSSFWELFEVLVFSEFVTFRDFSNTDHLCSTHNYYELNYRWIVVIFFLCLIQTCLVFSIFIPLAQVSLGSLSGHTQTQISLSSQTLVGHTEPNISLKAKQILRRVKGNVDNVHCLDKC